MTEQEDISPCYITKRGNLEVILLTLHYIYRRYRLEAAFRTRASETQANSQVCLRGMSKCVIKRGLRKSGAMPHKEKCAENNY